MNLKDQKIISTVEEEEADFSWSGFFIQSKRSIRNILRQWKYLLLAGIIGLLLGWGYTVINPPTYTSRISFVVEDTKAAGGGLMSALSGLGGLDISGMLGGSGMLAGDNIMAILKSRVLMKQALLSSFNEAGSYSLADRYAEVYGWKAKWAKDDKIKKVVSFPAGKFNLSRQDDSLFQKILKRLEEKEMSIYKPDKKLTVFNLETTTRDEQLSQLFVDRLLKITGDFYIETKTKKLKDNVNRLQRRADSIGGLLNRKTYSASQAELMLLNGNPAFTAPTVSAEISGREKGMIGTIYGEIVRNLEISKTALIQETPTVQIIDHSEMPLKKNEVKWYEGMLLGFLAGLILAALLMLFTQKRNQNL